MQPTDGDALYLLTTRALKMLDGLCCSQVSNNRVKRSVNILCVRVRNCHVELGFNVSDETNGINVGGFRWPVRRAQSCCVDAEERPIDWT